MIEPIKRFLVCVGFLVFGMFASVPAFSQDAEPDCSDPQTQFDMNQCAGEDYDKADTELNAEYKTLRKIMMQRDKDADENMKSAVDALAATQRAWVVYRDANCGLVGLQAQGGTMQPMITASCLADMSRKRAEELKSLADEF